jgi:ribonucleoside-diphosphate reductase alpha chain
MGRLFVTANAVGVNQHLRIQQAFQRHVDNAVSKTINLPEDADQDRLAHAYLTIYRSLSPSSSKSCTARSTSM